MCQLCIGKESTIEKKCSLGGDFSELGKRRQIELSLIGESKLSLLDFAEKKTKKSGLKDEILGLIDKGKINRNKFKEDKNRHIKHFKHNDFDGVSESLSSFTMTNDPTSNIETLTCDAKCDCRGQNPQLSGYTMKKNGIDLELIGNNPNGLSEISEKLNLLLNTQNVFMQTVLGQNQKLIEQYEKIAAGISSLTYEPAIILRNLIGTNFAGIKPCLESVQIQSPPKHEASAWGLVNRDTLIYSLTKKSKFKYILKLKEDINFPIIKDRNMRVVLGIFDKEENRFIDSFGPLLVRLAVFTSENPAIEIKENKSGNKILKGQSLAEFQDGECLFEKVQVREVTSHFKNGWIFLVGLPIDKEILQHAAPKQVEDISKMLLDDVEPFVLENVKVKAKLISKKKQFCPHE